jgi:hypothetical protein
MRHFYEAARQVTRFVVADSAIPDRPPVSAHGPSTSQDVRANEFASRLVVKPLTSRGPSHFYARSAWHDIVPAHDTIRGRRRALYGTALESGHMSHRADASSLTTATDYDGPADGAAVSLAAPPWARVG